MKLGIKILVAWHKFSFVYALINYPIYMNYSNFDLKSYWLLFFLNKLFESVKNFLIKLLTYLDDAIN